MTIYTIGFTKKSAREFFETLRRSGAKHLFDIRLHNKSQLAGFAKQDDLRYDKGYDDHKNFEAIVKEFDAEPIIKTRAEIPIFGSPARPFCPGGRPLVYRSWDKNKGIQYQCPERAGKATCPLPEKCPLKIMWIRPVHDYRRFGYRVARNTEEWVNLYNHRTAIERINSRLKYERRLDSHCFRGFDKIRFHCALAVLSLLAGALVKAQQYKLDEIRVCVRTIA